MGIDVKVRHSLFDVTKALMMLWVIWGHLGLYHIVDVSTFGDAYIQNAKIGVNMPVFFMISGYFAALTFEKCGWSKIAARSVGLLWPQTALAAVVAVFGLLLSVDFSESVEYLLTIWFLRTMLVVYVLAALAYKLFNSDVLRWTAMIFIYGMMIFLPASLKFFWIGQSAHMFPYFVFGLMVLHKHEVYKTKWISMLCGMFFLGAVILEGDEPTVGMSFWSGATHWSDVVSSTYNIMTFFARTAVGIAGSIFTLFIFDRLLRIWPRLSSIAVFGTTTMGVYVLHEVVLINAGETFPFLHFPSWTRWLVAIVYFLVCHFVVISIKRCAAVKFMFFGDEKRTESLFSFLSKFDRR